MDESALECAQNVDGTLRDASQIKWFNDRDDELPTSGPNASSSQLHPFFTGAAKPVGVPQRPYQCGQGCSQTHGRPHCKAG
ncbi:hypothetical protein C8R44DRAFT_817659, partial [Mycena epipterygia]